MKNLILEVLNSVRAEVLNAKLDNVKRNLINANLQTIEALANACPKEAPPHINLLCNTLSRYGLGEGNNSVVVELQHLSSILLSTNTDLTPIQRSLIVAVITGEDMEETLMNHGIIPEMPDYSEFEIYCDEAHALILDCQETVRKRHALESARILKGIYELSLKLKAISDK